MADTSPAPSIKEGLKDEDVDVSVREDFDSASLRVATATKEKCTEGMERGSLMFILGAVIVEFVVWGFPLTFGVFQRYYINLPEFKDSSLLSTVGTLATGITYIAAPFFVPLSISFPSYRVHMITAGAAICALSLTGSSFSTQVWHLVVSQGIGYGFGFILLYYPVLSMLNEWYVQRRGKAYGALSAIGGTSGLVFPNLLQHCLETYGHATTLRAMACVIVLTVGPAIFLLRPRQKKDVDTSAVLTSSPKPKASVKIDWSVFLTVKFLTLTWSNVFQGIFFFIPSVWLPTYATAMGYTTAQGTTLLVVLNVSSMVSQILVGILSDHHLALPMFASTLVSSISVLTLWKLSSTYAGLVLFAVTFGLFAGGYSVFYGRFLTELSADLDTGMWLVGLFDFERGIGVVIAGPVSGAMVGAGSHRGDYDALILATGISMAISCLSIVGWAFASRRKVVAAGEMGEALVLESRGGVVVEV